MSTSSNPTNMSANATVVTDNIFTAPSSNPTDDTDDDLSKMPPPSLKLSRTLSHQVKATDAAQMYFDRCQEGETILANFFTDHFGDTTLEYYQKENGVMVLHHIEAPRKEITIKFTYQATQFGF
jgi:hypothetical protein